MKGLLQIVTTLPENAKGSNHLNSLSLGDQMAPKGHKSECGPFLSSHSLMHELLVKGRWRGKGGTEL